MRFALWASSCLFLEKEREEMLEKRFTLAARHTDLRTEVAAGFTTFMTMAYILFVNPSILSNIPGLEHSVSALAAATALTAAIPTLLMALLTNTPYALAPGMGLNGVLTFDVCLQHHIPWQTAIGALPLAGAITPLPAPHPLANGHGRRCH